MSTAQQLYRLQEVELEIESREEAVRKLTGQLGDSAELIKTRVESSAAQQHLAELKKQQQTLEWQDDDLTSTLKTAEDELYSGRNTNPKELKNLQTEIASFKTKRGQLDEKILVLMDQIEAGNQKVSSLVEQLKVAEIGSREQQKQFTAEIEQNKAALAELEQEKQALIDSLEQQITRLYYELKKKKKTAVAKVSQGTCSACRIQLPITDLQRVRSGSVVQCSSCGRILYLP